MPRRDVDLRPMRQDELPAFRMAFISAWAEDLRRVDGLTAEQAVASAAEGFDTALPEGVETPQARLFVIEAEQKRVGTLWLEIEGGRAHVADITVDERHRRRGFGTQAIRLAEREARRSGADAIGLNVYADNPVAIRLYERLGYKPVRLTMRKSLG